MANTTEKVKFVKENFMRFHNEGLTILEIAEKCGVSRRYIYHCLQEIADANDVSRESLLEVPHRKHVIVNKPSPKVISDTLISVSELNKLQADINDLLCTANAMVKKFENIMTF